MIKCVVFDLDDTLYDEQDYCKSGFFAVTAAVADLKKADQKQVFQLLCRNFQAGRRLNLFNSVLDELKITYDDNFIAELVNVYRSHTPSIELPEESRRVLERLKKKYKLALITDGFLPAQYLKVQTLGIVNSGIDWTNLFAWRQLAMMAHHRLIDHASFVPITDVIAINT